jgi:hypothetical protein
MYRCYTFKTEYLAKLNSYSFMVTRYESDKWVYFYRGAKIDFEVKNNYPFTEGFIK